jgi:hypothetical protein
MIDPGSSDAVARIREVIPSALGDLLAFCEQVPGQANDPGLSVTGAP